MYAADAHFCSRSNESHPVSSVRQGVRPERYLGGSNHLFRSQTAATRKAVSAAGRRIHCTTLRRLSMTTRGRLRRIPTLIGCCGGRCMILRCGGWAGWRGRRGCFLRRDDIAKFAQALLDKLLRNAGPFPLKQATLQAMTRPQQPATAVGGATIFKQDGTTTTGVALRGFGWDINSAYSRPRGTVFATVVTAKATSGVAPSFGHTGYTGTSLWIDPASDTYVVLLANSVHPRGGASISPLRGEVATDAGESVWGLEQRSPTPTHRR